MKNKFKSFFKSPRKILSGDFKPDYRYRNPKEAPKVSEELITKTINDTEIYSKAREAMFNAQRKQVAYGIEKYPEPLNADTWSIIETIEHTIDESVDKLHYLVMLKIQLERLLVEEEPKDKAFELSESIQKLMNERNNHCINIDISNPNNLSDEEIRKRFEDNVEKMHEEYTYNIKVNLPNHITSPEEIREQFQKWFEDNRANFDKGYVNG